MPAYSHNGASNKNNLLPSVLTLRVPPPTPTLRHNARAMREIEDCIIKHTLPLKDRLWKRSTTLNGRSSQKDHAAHTVHRSWRWIWTTWRTFEDQCNMKKHAATMPSSPSPSRDRALTSTSQHRLVRVV